MKAVINKSVAKGIVKAPPSKSLAHRMLICAGLSRGESVVHDISSSQDILATLDCLEALGAKYRYDGNTIYISGTDLSNISNTILPCRECGSTLRFFVPIALLLNKDISFTGSERLLSRPMSVYETLCNEKGFKFTSSSEEITVNGKLESGEYTLRGDVSSQFITGLLFALPLCEKDSTIHLLPPLESRSYINLTLQALHIFGIDADWVDDLTLHISGNQHYVNCEVTVEGDYSNAAFLDALTSIGGDVTVTGLNDNSLQGDKVYKEHIKSLEKGFCTIDLSDCPDLGPILFTLAAYHNGAKFIGTHRLKIKESDRAEAMAEELSKYGAKLLVSFDEVIVEKCDLHSPTQILDGHNDHRIVMSLATLSTIFGGTIDGAHAVSKSYPDYFEVLKYLDINLKITE